MTFVFAGFLSVASSSVSRLRRPQSLGCVGLSPSVASVSVSRLRRAGQKAVKHTDHTGSTDEHRLFIGFQ